jgi:hypothetical protein
MHSPENYSAQADRGIAEMAHGRLTFWGKHRQNCDAYCAAAENPDALVNNNENTRAAIDGDAGGGREEGEE